jgi:hypothetical protein
MDDSTAQRVMSTARRTPALWNCAARDHAGRPAPLNCLIG